MGEDRGGNARRGVVVSLVAAVPVAAAIAWKGLRGLAGPGKGYQTVAQWRIPDGEGRFIAVAPGTGPAELRRLGDRLRGRWSRSVNAVVMIFDDPGAARQVLRGVRGVGETRFDAALRHQVAMYLKQNARGEHRLTIYDGYPRELEHVRY